jgi:hypothetical protein
MANHCPTCCCEHAGKFPRFAFYYADGSEYRGGGPDDTEQVVYSLPRSWVEMPALGVMVGQSEDPVVGRRNFRGAEQYYALAHQCRGGPDVTITGPETRLVPVVCGQYGIVKLGEHTTTAGFHEFMRRAQEDKHVPPQSARSPNELVQNPD